MKKLLAILFIIITNFAYADNKNWMELIRKNEVNKAKQLCNRLEASTNTVDKASAYKCYANLVLMDKDIVIIEGNDIGGGMLRGGWGGKPLDQAIAFLNKAIELTPNDESIHQGRMHLLLTSGLYTKALDAVKDSLKVINTKEHLELWLDYTPYYQSTSQFKAGIEFTHQLIQQFGDDHRLYANLGAFYSMIGEDDNAIKYLKKAVKMRPSSPLNTWNLARLYDFTGKLKKADRLYNKALSLKAGPYDTDLDPQSYCLYSEFLLKKMNNKKKACKYNKDFCSIENLLCN